jgi:glycine cleavage system H protein
MSGSDPSELTFMMGEFRAVFPTDRQYASNHMWVQAIDPRTVRCGFTAYAVRLLQDVYFLDWVIDPDTPVKLRQMIGSIESKKAESDLFAPAAGVIRQFNQAVLEDPALINVEPYARGWLFELSTADPQWLSPTEYLAHLEQAWEVAQRTIKGQMNDA